jgi:molybdopterin-guanine dinucleotide biosynthesis protein A
MEPLFAVYRRKNVLKAAAIQLKLGKRSIHAIFGLLRVNKLNPPDRRWYRNINTPGQYRELQRNKGLI